MLLLVVKDYDFLSCYKSCLQKLHQRSWICILWWWLWRRGKESKNRYDHVRVRRRGGWGGGGVQWSCCRKPLKHYEQKQSFCVGSCAALHCDKTKLGDVVISAKLTTYAQPKLTKEGVEKLGYTIQLDSWTLSGQSQQRNSETNQSKFEDTTSNRCQARENACYQVTISCGFASHWLRKWREIKSN